MAVSLLQLALTGIFAVSSLLQLALTGIFAVYLFYTLFSHTPDLTTNPRTSRSLFAFLSFIGSCSVAVLGGEAQIRRHGCGGPPGLGVGCTGWP
eukprot:5460094-Prymnesium_polylepis.1